MRPLSHTILPLLCALGIAACSQQDEATPRTEVTVEAPAATPAPAVSAPAAADPELANTAEQVVPQFHLAYMDQVYASIYNSAAPDMRLFMPQHEFVAYMEGIRRKMGQVQAAKRSDATAVGNVVTLRYNTTYEKGPAVEEFTVRVSGKDAALLGYRMVSPSTF
ncbi:hypothetical protein [Viridibacterium curvum]|uniref:DUF3887 domain-containing protein n=1 Tax=Viridibacterium curvum TaxID=1101404 RepID=A0ABP9QJM9_9RHOO